MKSITAVLLENGSEYTQSSIQKLKSEKLIKKIILLSSTENQFNDCEIIKTENPFSSQSIASLSDKIDSEYTLFLTKDTEFELGYLALERMIYTADSSEAGLLYSDYFELKEGVRSLHPVIDYQDGSLRDDFNFGALILLNSSELKKAASEDGTEYKFAGLYNLRLKISQSNKIVRIPEPLYTAIEQDTRKSGEKQFDYVDPKNRIVQIEMETAVTEHLKSVGAYLNPEFEKIEFSESDFPVEASVIIPVKNRAKTIGDAIKSIVSQKTDFKFNLIIVDNYSDDGTTEIIKSFVEKDDKIVHLIPERKDLGIGGCWNAAVHSEYCGKFACQLDSDDLYSSEGTLQKIIDAFYQQNCAMVVGTYQMTNFALEEIPPGIIDHKEWTPENGRNNALRINGLGAPRAFYTPVLRSINIPNTSYGEDYAVGLYISRDYQIGRIYEPIYMCRRWDGNSDAALDTSKQNRNNFYKDKVRTIELWARQKKNGNL